MQVLNDMHGIVVKREGTGPREGEGRAKEEEEEEEEEEEAEEAGGGGTYFCRAVDTAVDPTAAKDAKTAAANSTSTEEGDPVVGDPLRRGCRGRPCSGDAEEVDPPPLQPPSRMWLAGKRSNEGMSPHLPLSLVNEYKVHR